MEKRDKRMSFSEFRNAGHGADKKCAKAIMDVIESCDCEWKKEILARSILENTIVNVAHRLDEDPVKMSRRIVNDIEAVDKVVTSFLAKLLGITAFLAKLLGITAFLAKLLGSTAEDLKKS